MAASEAIDFNRLADKIRDAGDIWADLEHAARLLTALKPAFKAQLILKHRTRMGGSSKSAEAAVSASEAWSNYLRAEAEALYAANKALVAYKEAQTRHEGGRSANAARNIEIAHLGG